MTPLPSTESISLSLALDPSERELLERATSLSGQDITHFARAALLDRARDLVQPGSVRVLSHRDATRFVDLLDAEVEPNEALRRAADRYRTRDE